MNNFEQINIEGYSKSTVYNVSGACITYMYNLLKDSNKIQYTASGSNATVSTMIGTLQPERCYKSHADFLTNPSRFGYTFQINTPTLGYYLEFKDEVFAKFLLAARGSLNIQGDALGVYDSKTDGTIVKFNALQTELFPTDNMERFDVKHIDMRCVSLELDNRATGMAGNNNWNYNFSLTKLGDDAQTMVRYSWNSLYLYFPKTNMPSNMLIFYIPENFWKLNSNSGSRILNKYWAYANVQTNSAQLIPIIVPGRGRFWESKRAFRHYYINLGHYDTTYADQMPNLNTVWNPTTSKNIYWIKGYGPLSSLNSNSNDSEWNPPTTFAHSTSTAYSVAYNYIIIDTNIVVVLCPQSNTLPTYLKIVVPDYLVDSYKYIYNHYKCTDGANEINIGNASTNIISYSEYKENYATIGDLQGEQNASWCEYEHDNFHQWITDPLSGPEDNWK